MTIDTKALRELAQQIAEHMRSENRTTYPRELMEQYIDAAHPFIVLALLDEIDSARNMLKSYNNMLVEIADALGIAPYHLTEAIAVQKLQRLQKIEAAAQNLAKVQGRHNSEQAMNKPLETLKS